MTPTIGAVTGTWTGFGTADDTNPFNNQFQAMVAGGVYVIPPGTVINHQYALGNREGAFTVAANVTLIVKGVTINATDPTASALYCTGLNGFTLIGDSSTNIGCANPGSRGSSYFVNRFTFKDSAGVRLFDGASNGSNAAGVFFYNCTDSFAARWTMVNSNADGFTMIGGCQRVYTYDCTSTNTGDDNFSLVSYAADPINDSCGHIRPYANGNTNGRGTTIVGGSNCFIKDQKTRSTSSAGSMIAAESNSDFVVHMPVGCWIDGGTIDTPNYGSDDHGGILVLNQIPSSNLLCTVGDITITNMQNTRPIVNCKNSNVGGAAMDGTVISNITGSGQYYGNTPYSTDGSIPRSFNLSTPATSGVTFDNCVAL